MTFNVFENPYSLGVLSRETLRALAEPFIRPRAALVLLGSHARGDAGPHSDLDLARFLSDEEKPQDDGSYLRDEQLIVVSSVTPSQLERCFTDPFEAVNAVAGLRTARALHDPEGRFAEVQARARAFRWTDDLNRRADAWVGSQMVGLIEEAHKGLGGLRRNDVGRLLNARFGLSWGLCRVMSVHKRLLLESDNSFYRQLEALADLPPGWPGLRDAAFGLKAGDLRAQVTAGLRLYLLTASDVGAALGEVEAALVKETVSRIGGALEP